MILKLLHEVRHYFGDVQAHVHSLHFCWPALLSHAFVCDCLHSSIEALSIILCMYTWQCLQVQGPCCKCLHSSTRIEGNNACCNACSFRTHICSCLHSSTQVVDVSVHGTACKCTARAAKALQHVFAIFCPASYKKWPVLYMLICADAQPMPAIACKRPYKL